MAVERLTQMQLEGFAGAVHDDDPDEISKAAQGAFDALVAGSSEGSEGHDWYQRYKRMAGAKVPWRIAVYVAWASVPKDRRHPKTQEELARNVLGLGSDRVITSWRMKYPEIDLTIAQLQSNELYEHRADVFDALIKSASTADYKNKPDRQLFLEMTGDYSPKVKIEDLRDPNSKDLSKVPESKLRHLAGQMIDEDTQFEDEAEDFADVE